MSENETNKGKIYVAYITMFGIPEITYALAYVVDEASASGVKMVAKHTSSSIGLAKQDIRHVYNLGKYKELFPQGYEMIDLDEIKIHCRVGIDLCTALAIDEVRRAAGLKDQMPHREEKKESSEQTHAEIVAECYHNTAATRYVRNLLNRLDAAHKREIDVLKQRCAELDAEVAAKDAVIMRLNDAISEEQRRKMATTENSSAVGNAAKLREALKLYDRIIQDRTLIYDCDIVYGARTLARAALAAPPRNCDVYSADELKAIFKRELVSELPMANEHEKNLVTITAMMMIDTLFATTKEGENDGNE